MATNETVGVNLEVNGGESVRGIRQQLREATADLLRMQERFGELSEPAIAAARNVAQLRDRIQEANEVAALFDPGRTFQSVIGVGQAIAGGFAAAQGAMALFGVESKEVEKALLKVQAAMALATGLSTVKDSIKDFERLGAMLMQIGVVQKLNAGANTLAAATMRMFGVATAQTGVAFNFLKGAIVATGIGALIIILGVLIQKMMEWVNAADEAAEAQKRLDDAAVQSAKDWSQKLLAANKEAEAMAIARAKSEGASAERIRLIQQRAAEDRIQILTDARNQVERDEKSWDQANTALMSARNAEQIKDYERQAAARDEAEKKTKEQRDKAAAAAKAAADKAKAERKAALDAAIAAEKETADDIFKAQHNAQENELYELAEKMEKRLAIEQKAGRDTTDVYLAWALERGAIEKKFIEEREKAEAEARTKRAEALRKQAEDEDAALAAQMDRERAYGEKRKEYNESELTHRRGIATSITQLADLGADIAGEQTAAGKTLAIIAATIATYQSAQQAYLSAFLPVPTVASPVLGVLSAGTAIAFGLNNIRKIAGINIPGKGGGASVPSISSSSPISPAGQTAQSVQLNQQSINGVGNALNGRVYVLESDITKTQDTVARTQQAASFK